MRELSNLMIILKNAIIAKKRNQLYKPKNFNLVNNFLCFLYQEGLILTYVFYNNNFIIYINYIEKVNFFFILKIFNKKINQRYITYKDLCTFTNNNSGQIIVLSTSKYGLIPHYKALRYKIGGKLFCLIQ